MGRISLTGGTVARLRLGDRLGSLPGIGARGSVDQHRRRSGGLRGDRSRRGGGGFGGPLVAAGPVGRRRRRLRRGRRGGSRIPGRHGQLGRRGGGVGGGGPGVDDAHSRGCGVVRGFGGRIARAAPSGAPAAAAVGATPAGGVLLTGGDGGGAVVLHVLGSGARRAARGWSAPARRGRPARTFGGGAGAGVVDGKLRRRLEHVRQQVYAATGGQAPIPPSTWRTCPVT